MNWQFKRRWTAAGDLGWPQLATAYAQQASSGAVIVGETCYVIREKVLVI